MSLMTCYFWFLFFIFFLEFAEGSSQGIKNDNETDTSGDLEVSLHFLYLDYVYNK